MSNVEQLPPSELDLHAFLDDELGPEERVRILEWLLEHPGKSKELWEIKLREDLLRNAVRQSVNGSGQNDLQALISEQVKSPSLPLQRQFWIGIATGSFLTLILTVLILAVR